MEGEPRNNRTGLAAGIIGVVVLLAVMAILLDLGPFADEPASATDELERQAQPPES